jgi:hypothetical protein
MPSTVFELIEVNRVRFSRGKEAAKMRAAGDQDCRQRGCVLQMFAHVSVSM